MPKASWDAKVVKGVGIYSTLMTGVAVVGELWTLAHGGELNPNGYFDYVLGGRIITDFSKLPEGFASPASSTSYGSGFYEKKGGEIYKDGKLLNIMQNGKLVSGGA